METPILPSPAAPSPTSTNKPKRPALVLVGLAAIAFKGGREVIAKQFGVAGAVIGGAVVLALIVGWRLLVRQRARRNGVVEYTPAMVQQQLAKSGIAGAAFESDGSLFGTSLMVVNQRSKLIEVETEYQVFGDHGEPIGHVRQIGQGKFKKVIRFFGAIDQFFTHHFDITDDRSEVVLRVTRPAKLFKTRVEVFNGSGQFVGRIVQQNVFGKINFAIYGADGGVASSNRPLAMFKAENWRAWDFRIELPSGVEVARITKTWEGMARTLFTSADSYVVRVHQRLGDPLRSLVFAAALTADLALKQDARGLGA